MLLLSYPLQHDTPLYAQEGSIVLKKNRDISQGDSCNNMVLEFPNHMGTHVDAPLHFSQTGKSITDVLPDFWFCHHILCLNLSQTIQQAIIVSPDCFDVKGPLFKNCRKVEAVILKTGFGKFRKQSVYWQESPVIATEWAIFLRNHFPKIKFFGIDLLSVSSLVHRNIGRATHRAFLDHDRPIWLIEDMDLSALSQKGLDNMLISPLFVAGADGVPCSVWGNIGK